jgi:hypothetical protein
MPSHETNAGRDAVEVHNRLDVIVLAVLRQDGTRAETTLTADQARAIGHSLEEAADAGEHTASR